MSVIECAQLHSELFRLRHCTRQSHGLFALAKLLFYIYRQYTQIIQCTTEYNKCRYNKIQETFQPLSVVRDLGVLLDAELSHQQSEPAANVTLVSSCMALCCSRDLDFDPTTFMYELDLDMPEYQNKLSTSSLSKVRIGQTHRQTDRQTRPNALQPHFRVVTRRVISSNKMTYSNSMLLAKECW